MSVNRPGNAVRASLQDIRPEARCARVGRQVPATGLHPRPAEYGQEHPLQPTGGQAGGPCLRHPCWPRDPVRASRSNARLALSSKASARAYRANLYPPPSLRDYKELRASLGDLEFLAIDTSGMEPFAEEGSIQDRLLLQTEGVVRRSDVVLLLLDAKSGLMPGDKDIARQGPCGGMGALADGTSFPPSLPAASSMQLAAEVIPRVKDGPGCQQVRARWQEAPGTDDCHLRRGLRARSRGAAADRGIDRLVDPCLPPDASGIESDVSSAAPGDGMGDLYARLQPLIDSATQEKLAAAGLMPAGTGAGVASVSELDQKLDQGPDPKLLEGKHSASPAADFPDHMTNRILLAGSGEWDEGEVSALERSLMDPDGEEEEEDDKTRSQRLMGADLPPLRVSLLGLPNVGKSTLANALLGKDRVLTGPEPGLTRDVIV